MQIYIGYPLSTGLYSLIMLSPSRPLTWFSDDHAPSIYVPKCCTFCSGGFKLFHDELHHVIRSHFLQELQRTGDTDDDEAAGVSDLQTVAERVGCCQSSRPRIEGQEGCCQEG